MFLLKVEASATTEPVSHEPTRVRLQLKWYHQFQFAGYYAAQAKGFYAEENLDVDIIQGDAEHLPIEQVLSGRADFGVSDADVLKSFLEGQPLTVLAAIFQHSPYVLLTRADSGLRTPSDLRGRSIMLSDEQGNIQLQAMFRREGMSLQDVLIVRVTLPPEIVREPGSQLQAMLQTPTPVPPRELLNDPPALQVWQSQPEIRAAFSHCRHYPMRESQPGVFLADEVPPGNYVLLAALIESSKNPTEPPRIRANSQTEVVVPGGSAKESIDLGEIRLAATP